MTQGSALIDFLMDGARLDSKEEAEDMIRSVTGAMMDQLPSEASEIVFTVVPSDLVGEGSTGRPREAASVDDLFAEVADRLGLGTADAARYVRVIAEAISRVMSDADLERLQGLVADEFLALFEVDHRGELTEDDGFTPGARMVDRGGDEPTNS